MKTNCPSLPRQQRTNCAVRCFFPLYFQPAISAQQWNHKILPSKMPGCLPALLTHKWRQMQTQTCTVTTCLCLPSGPALPFPPISVPHWLQPDGPTEAKRSWITWLSYLHLFYTSVQGRTVQHERGWQSTTLCKNLSPGWVLEIREVVQNGAALVHWEE